MFPSPTPTNTEFEGVTKVDIRWEMKKVPGFMVTLKRLPRSEVKTSIQAALRKVSQLTRRSSVPSESELCYLRLSETHIRMIEYNSAGDENGLVQVPTRSSILLSNENVYMKMYPAQTRAKMLLFFLKLMYGMKDNRMLLEAAPHEQLRSQMASFPLLIPEVHKEFLSVFIFPALPHQPLETDEAKRCFKELVTKVSSALQLIHGERILLLTWMFAYQTFVSVTMESLF